MANKIHHRRLSFGDHNFFAYALLLFFLAGCKSASNENENVTQPPESSGAESAFLELKILSELGDLGFDPITGKPLIWDTSHVADLTGDGKNDLLIYTTYDHDLQLTPSPFLVLSERNGSLADITHEVFPRGAPKAVNNRNVLTADINGNGLIDIFLDNHGTEAIFPFPGERNQIFFSNERGEYFEYTDTHLPDVRDFSHGSAIADINGDGKKEIFVNNLGGGEKRHYLLIQDGEGKFRISVDFEHASDPMRMFPPQVFDSPGPFWSIFVDANGNELPDLYFNAVRGVWGGDFDNVLLKNKGSNRFELVSPDFMPSLWRFEGFDPPVAHVEAQVVADITGNGLSDLLSFVRYGDFVGSYFSVMVNVEDGFFVNKTEEIIPGQDFGPISTNIPSFQLVDINGNGNLDLVSARYIWISEEGGENEILREIRLNDGEGRFLRTGDVPEFHPAFAVIDANGNGFKDIVTGIRDFSSLGETQIGVFYNSGP